MMLTVCQSYNLRVLLFLLHETAQKHSASAQAKVSVISKFVAKVMLSSLLTNYPKTMGCSPGLTGIEGRGHGKNSCLENALAGFGRSLLLPFLLLLARGQRKDFHTKQRKQLNFPQSVPPACAAPAGSPVLGVLQVLALPNSLLTEGAASPSFHSGTVLGQSQGTQTIRCSHCLHSSLTLPRDEPGSCSICKILPG